jgi:hypothetical protein
MLARWSFGMVLARSCALTAVSHMRATGRQRKEPTVRQHLREWDDDTTRTRGATRCPWRPVVPPCGGGSCAGGRGPHGLWPSTPRRGGSGVWSSRCASCLAEALSRSPGASSPRAPHTPGDGHGSGCSGGGTGRFHAAGPGWYWPIAAYRPHGCCGGARGWGGIRLCGATRGAAVGPLRPSCASCRGPARASGARASPCPVPRGTAPWWRGGKQATQTRGGSARISPRRRVMRAGMVYGPGSHRAVKSRNALGGRGSGRVGGTRTAPPASGARWRSRRCGCAVWARWPMRRFLRARFLR